MIREVGRELLKIETIADVHLNIGSRVKYTSCIVLTGLFPVKHIYSPDCLSKCLNEKKVIMERGP